MARILAIGWVTGMALLYLIRYDGWVAPLQMADLFRETLPMLAIGPHFGEFLRMALTNAGCAVAILAVAFAVGAVAVNRFTPEKNLLTALFSMAAGLWLLSVAILLVGVISISCLPWVFLLAGCWLLPAPRGFFHRVGAASENHAWRQTELDGWAKLMLACVIAAALLNLLSAMAPPFEYDALEYHLGGPAEYIKTGRIITLPHNFFSNMPQLTEMLYLLALKASSGVAATLLHWSFGVLGAVSVHAIAARLWNKQIGVTSATLFYCVPLMLDLSGTARIDLATTFFAVLAFGAFVLWADTGPGRGKNAAPTDSGWLWLSALATGAAVATKWTAVPVVVLPVFVFLVVTTKSFRAVFVFCLLSFAVVVPWLVKNWLFMGNPVYPLLYGVFSGSHWSVGQAALFAQKHYASFGWDGCVRFVGLIWQYSFKERFTIPLLLMTAPLVLLLRNVMPSARRVGWLFVAAYAGWFLLTFRPWRFLFPAFPLAAMTGAYALHVVAQGKFARTVIRAAVAVLVVVGLAQEMSVALVDQEDCDRLPPQMDFVQYALGQVSRDEFVERMGGGVFEPVVWMNKNLPPPAKVLYVGEARVALARHAVAWATAFDQHPLTGMTQRAKTPEELLYLMRERGISHVYINFSELQRLGMNYGYLQDADWLRFRSRLEEHAEIVHVSERGVVYALRSARSP